MTLTYIVVLSFDFDLFFPLKISTMREEEKLLRQKLADTEKAKKQLQSDVANRDRTIQLLKVVR